MERQLLAWLLDLICRAPDPFAIRDRSGWPQDPGITGNAIELVVLGKRFRLSIHEVTA